MFKQFLNPKEVNRFVKSFQPFFKSKEYKEYREKSFHKYAGRTYYIAKNEDLNWALSVSFSNRLNNGLNVKNYYPEVSFMLKSTLPTDVIKKEAKSIIEHLDKKYPADYEQISKIVNIFIEKGMQSGLINNVENKKYIKNMSSHFGLNSELTRVESKDKPIATVNFNNILQKRTSKNINGLKKSNITVKLIHLVHHDENIQPYFLIKLPYTANKKIACVISLKDTETVFYAATDEPLKTGYLIRLTPIKMNDVDLAKHFERLFKTEAQHIITETLDMHLSDIYTFGIQELRDYLTIASMVKL